jgi:hypothetical protein
VGGKSKKSKKAVGNGDRTGGARRSAWVWSGQNGG